MRFTVYNCLPVCFSLWSRNVLCLIQQLHSYRPTAKTTHSPPLDPRALSLPLHVPQIPLSLWPQPPPSPWASLVPLFCSSPPFLLSSSFPLPPLLPLSSSPPPLLLLSSYSSSPLQWSLWPHSTLSYLPQHTLTAMEACFGYTCLPYPNLSTPPSVKHSPSRYPHSP